MLKLKKTNIHTRKILKTLLCLGFLIQGFGLILPAVLADDNTTSTIEIKTLTSSTLTADSLGIGGGGALFEPAISPFDSNEMLVVPDMGGIYISHDKGENWDRVELHGTVLSATYDPNQEGVIYAGGSGLWRSTDYGKTFELIFPNESDITAKRLNNSNGLQYYFTTSGIYDRNRYIKDILIDPEDSTHIFALGYSYRYGVVYESTDNGENFTRLFTYSKSSYLSEHFDFNELLYRRETKDIFVINDEAVIGYDRATGITSTVYSSSLGLVDVATVYENNQTNFIIIEKVDGPSNTNTSIYYTNDFSTKTDLTDTIVDGTNASIQKVYTKHFVTEVGDNYFVNTNYGKVTFKYDFSYVSATSLNNIYITNKSYAETWELKQYTYAIDGIMHYKSGEVTYLYGNPYYNHNNLSSRSWNDGATYALGIAASNTNEDEYIFTTLNGVYYAPDSSHIYPRHSAVVDGVYPNATFVTTGIDEQKTYGVIEDPFNEGVLLLLNTDLGLVRSEDNGKSWSWITSGIPSTWQNTVYAAEFDQQNKGVVYSLWSSRHDAPNSAGNETDGRYGGFAISYDGGKTWDSTYSSGLPSYVIPVKMSVIYGDVGDEATIYVATFNCGFYVSYDSGKTFTEMNNGLEKIEYQTDEKYHYILARDIEVKDGRIFGLTAKTSYNSGTQPGKLYEYVSGTWVEIPLPTNAEDPTDIVYYDGVLYLSGIAKSIWDGKNGAEWNLYSGGIYAYENGEFKQIFDESISTGGLAFDSKGTIYFSDIEGNIYRKEKSETAFLKIYEYFHYRSDGVQVTEDGDTLYLSTHGGGLLRLSNLSSLYQDKQNPSTDDNNKGGNTSGSTGENTSNNTSGNTNNNTNNSNSNASASPNYSPAKTSGNYSSTTTSSQVTTSSSDSENSDSETTRTETYSKEGTIKHADDDEAEFVLQSSESNDDNVEIIAIIISGISTFALITAVLLFLFRENQDQPQLSQPQH